MHPAGVEKLSVPLSYAEDQQGFRLLELPPEILQLLTTNNAAKLYLKSAPPSSGSASPLVLCTSQETYQLRQVQTSNSVLLLQPTTLAQDADFNLTSAVTAFASCNSTLELEKFNRSETSKIKTAKQWLLERLSVYAIDHDAHSSFLDLNLCKTDIICDIPLSDRECEDAWSELVAFELHGNSFKPAPKVLLQLWTCIEETASMLNIDLTKQFEVRDIWQGVEEAGFPLALFHALIVRLSCSDMNEETDVDRVIFQESTTITWLGELLFDAGVYDAENMTMWMFINKWKSLLPSKWSDDVTSQAFMAVQRRKSSISASESKIEAAVDDLAPLKSVNGVKRPGMNNRNWHERLKPNRK